MRSSSDYVFLIHVLKQLAILCLLSCCLLNVSVFCIDGCGWHLIPTRTFKAVRKMGGEKQVKKAFLKEHSTRFVINQDTHASVYPENFLPLFLVMGWPSSSTIKSSISVEQKHIFLKLITCIPHQS